MKAKQIFFLLVVFLLIYSEACKKKTPTGPDTDSDGTWSLDLGGIITLNEQPFSNVDVYLSWSLSKKTTTGADGKYNFGNLLNGLYFITPSKQGYAFSPSSYEAVTQARNDLNFAAQLATYGTEIGNIAADFAAKNQKNKNISLYDYFGKVILFEFSADWCGPCRDEATHLEDLYSTYKNQGFQVITLLIHGSSDDWAEEYNITFPVLDDNDEEIWSIYGQGYIPLNIIVDRNCTIRYKDAGYSENSLKAIIEKYL